MDLNNKTILITGASSGIGEATAIEIARYASRVYCVGRRKNELDRVVELIKERHGDKGVAIEADITREEGRSRILDVVGGGPLHVLINNAGITAHGRFDASAPSVLRDTMELNFFAMSELTRILLPVIKKTEGEKLIALVSSPSGFYGIPGRFAYSASKAAGHAIMETLRIELKPFSVRTLIFAPGYTRTALRTSGLAADGSVLAEKQASGAKEPGAVATLLIRAIRKNRRYAFTDLNGRAAFLLRQFPSLFDRILAKKLKDDF